MTGAPRVAVIVSRFPKFTETFVINEILELERLGLEIEIHPLLPVEPVPHQPAAVPLVERAHFGRPLGRPELAALVSMVRHRPKALFGIVTQLLRDTWRRPGFLAKDVVLLPRICAVARRVETGDVDHVHAHFATHAGFAAWAISRLTGVPYSIVAHGSDVHRHQVMLPVKVAEAAFVAAVSDFNRSVILATCGASAAQQVEVVRVGVDTEGIRPRPHRSLPATPTVLCVGTLHEVKGQRHLVEATAHLAETGTDFRLELVGDGPDRASLETLVTDLGIPHRVHLAGAVTHDEVIRRFGEADLVVVPSVASSDGRKEGLPTVVMEAMASGVPVVASDLAGIPELVRHGETGLLVAPGDAAGLADAIRRVFEDDGLRARMCEAALERVSREFSVQETAARMAALIRRSANPLQR